MKKLFKEPLFHFLLLGLGLFLIYGLVSKNQDNEETIIINDYDINNIIASWEMQWKRLPTDEELKSLIQQNIKQEIFYQEALKMNLDHNDEIIKRRLSQKMQFLASDIANLNEPTLEELKAYYNKNIANYMSPYTYTMYQIIFSPDNRLDPKKDALNVLEKVKDQSPEKAEGKGDSMSFPFQYRAVDATELNRALGMEFTQSLEKLETKNWEGPVKSGFGYHLVYLVEKIAPQPIAFESIRTEVLRDLEYENQKNLQQEIFDQYRSNYHIDYNLDPAKFDAAFIEFLKNKDL